MSQRPDPHTKDLLAWEAQSVRVGYGTDVAGGGDLPSQISRLLSRALSDARDRGLMRADVSCRMAKFLDRSIPKGTLDKWASEAAEDRVIPLDAFIAFIKATEERRLLAFIPRQFDCAVVSDRYATLIELQELEEHEREIQARKSALTAAARGARR